MVIIQEADSLTRDAQAALRRTVEKYMSNMRIILCANSTSKLIAPIKSRCLLVRVAAPSTEEVRRPCDHAHTHGTGRLTKRNVLQIVKVLKHVASRQPFRSIDDEVALEIAQDSNGNLRKALLVFEALKMQS